MRISIVVAGFTKKHQRLQPWRYFGEIAVEAGAIRKPSPDLHGCDRPRDTYATRSRGHPDMGSPAFRLARSKAPCRPPVSHSVVVWNVGRLGPLYPIRGSNRDIDVAVLTAPLYNATQLVTVLRASWRHPGAIVIHLAGVVIPLRILARHLASRYNAVITLADYAASRLVAAGFPQARLHVVKPSLGVVDSPSRLGQRVQERDVIAFAGNASYVRGADVLVKAFATAFRNKPEMRLRLALRHEDERLSADEARLLRLVDDFGIAGQVEVSGNMAEEELLRLFGESRAVVLPFRVVPSEAPLMPLEIGPL